MRVSTLQTKGGNAAVNQFVINTHDGQFFQSYNTMIASRNWNGDVQLRDGYWDNYSATTNYYLNQFLGTSGIAEIRDRVENDSQWTVVSVIA